MADTMTPSLIIMGVLIVLLGFLRLRHVSVQGLALGLMGTVLGLLVGALASVPLSKLPGIFGSIMPVAVTVVVTVVLTGIVIGRRNVLLQQLPFLRLEDSKGDDQSRTSTAEGKLPRILVDTSVIIDGRIADIATAGFVPGRLAVPRFVLAELQNIADSDDAMRRGRGRRGLDVLNRLREMPDVQVEIIEDDAPSIREVDAKLVALAQRFGCNVLTTDYNLNRVAQIQGVRVLNVNELSNAIRPVVLPGEQLVVKVVQPGKERNQGVGYLADGTMIVVENGDKLIGQDVITEVTRVFQTVAGKMIFATPRQSINAGPAQDAQISKSGVSEAGVSAETAAGRPEETEEFSNGSNGTNKAKRFNRNRRRSNPADTRAGANGQNGKPDRSNPRQNDIEERIIAATSKPHHHNGD